MNRNVWQVVGAVFVLLLLIRLFNISYPVYLRVTNSTVSSEFSVIGTGKVDVVPDTAVVDAGITVNNVSTAEEAKNQMTTINNDILKEVKALGVDAKDIKTSNFSIYPEYATSGIEPLTVRSVPSSGESRISGYSGNANVTIKLRNKDLASQVVEKVTVAGATNVNGPRFTLENPQMIQEEARAKAIENAKEQAKKLSKDLGIRLGRITNMVESPGYSPYTYGRGGAMTLDATKEATAPEFEEGTETVSSTVTLFYETK